MSQQLKQAESLADYYIDRLSGWAKLTQRPLFGAVGIYRDHRVFAMVWHGALYFKVDDFSRPKYEAAGSHPLEYVSAGQELALKSYWEVPAEIVEDNEALHSWATSASQAANR